MKFIVAIAIFACAKMFFFGVSIGESLAMLFILGAVQANKVIDYKFPERPDLYSQSDDHKKRIENLESDITALKLGALRK